MGEELGKKTTPLRFEPLPDETAGLELPWLPLERLYVLSPREREEITGQLMELILRLKYWQLQDAGRGERLWPQ